MPLIPGMESIGLAITAQRHDHPAPPGHPERYDKLSEILPELDKPEYQEFIRPMPERSYDPALLETVHDAAHLRVLKQKVAGSTVFLDDETYLTESSFTASCKVTWALIGGVEAAFGSGPAVSFVIGRPPGHHAERDRAMGFCIVNHVAVAARYAQNHHDATRIAIVDFDIHHGNGTQHIFYDCPDVLYVSTHQFPYYPGTGSAEEKGSGDGVGTTLNLPCPAGTGDDDMTQLFENEISETLRSYRPDLILVSAGFDGHHLDPLGDFRLTGNGFKRMGQILVTLAGELCEGRLVSLLEGGYDPAGNLDSISNYMKGLATL